MHFLKVVSVMCVIGAIAGCAVNTGGAPVAPASGGSAPMVQSVPSAPTVAQPVSHAKCERPGQKECLGIDLLNAKWDEKSPFAKEIEQARISKERRIDLGPSLYKAVKAGEMKVSAPRTFTIFMWNVEEVPDSHLAEYRVNGNTFTKVDVVAGGGVLNPPKFESITNLGEPNKVYRVKANGAQPIGVTLQIPWSMIKAGTYILVCTEDHFTVYPNRITAEEGHWITPKALADARTKGWVYMILPFVSKDAQPSIKKPVVKKPVKKAEGEEQQLALASNE